MISKENRFNNLVQNHSYSIRLDSSPGSMGTESVPDLQTFHFRFFLTFSWIGGGGVNLNREFRPQHSRSPFLSLPRLICSLSINSQLKTFARKRERVSAPALATESPDHAARIILPNGQSFETFGRCIKLVCFGYIYKSVCLHGYWLNVVATTRQ